jgi:hypothetical protein
MNLVNSDIYAPHGIMPNTDQVSEALDSINPAAGQLSLSIPVDSLQEGRAGLGSDLKLTYDSNLFNIGAP